MADDDLMARVRQMTLELPGSRKSIADFLVREGSGVANLSMAEVADLTFTSKPSLVRFAKAMGFAGWRDFRLAFVTATRASEAVQASADIDPNHPFGPDDDLPSVVSRVALLERQAIAQAEACVDQDVLLEAASRVLSARNLVFFGLAPNSYFGELFAYKLNQVGVTCHVPGQDEWPMVARGLGPGDCAIVCSYSGMGPHRAPASYMARFNEAQVPVVAITNAGSNYLHEQCDCVLSFRPREHIYGKISGYYSEQSVGFLLDALFSACFAANYDRNEVIKLRAIIAFERHNQAFVDVLPD